MPNALKAPVVAPGLVVVIPRSQIRRYEGQPRRHFPKAELLELRDSILAEGQITEIAVRALTAKEKREDPQHRYELIRGERRWRATGLISRDYPLRAVIREPMDEAAQFAESFTENMQRQDMTPMEIALGLEKMRCDRNCTQTELAATCGKDQAYVSKHLSLLRLCSEVQAMLDPEQPEDDQLNTSVAVMLVSFPAEQQAKLARHILNEGMKSKAARHYIAKKMSGLNGDHLDGRRMRPTKPSDHYRTLDRFLRRLQEDTDILLEMKSPAFREMFSRRSEDDRKKALLAIDEAENRLRQLYQAIKFQKGSAASA